MYEICIFVPRPHYSINLKNKTYSKEMHLCTMRKVVCTWNRSKHTKEKPQLKED